jgi:pimeloyl-ACP methyl ester carboxylesterase/DNA-binding CsgD family transcriptional regulator
LIEGSERLVAGRSTDSTYAWLADLWQDSQGQNSQTARVVNDVHGSQVLLLAAKAETAMAAPLTAEARISMAAPRSLLILAQRGGFGEHAQKLAMAAFGLTQAESRVSFAVAQGLKLADIAVQFGVTRETIKKQLYRVYEKTGTNRQANLVSLILQLCTIQLLVAAEPSEAELPKANLPPPSAFAGKTMRDPHEFSLCRNAKGMTQFFTGKDGRRISYSTWGDTSHTARPLLLLHASFASRAFNLSMTIDAKAAKRRVYYLERPGFGETEAAPGNLFEASFSDIDSLIDLLGVEAIDVLGVGSGAMYGWEFARRRSDRVKALALFSPRRFFKATEQKQFNGAMFRLGGLEADSVQALANLALPDRSDAAIDRLTSSYFAGSPGDSELLQSQPTLAVFCRDVLRMTLAHGSAAVVEEILLLSQNTAETLYKPLNRSVIVAYGERDGINSRPPDLEDVPAQSFKIKTIPHYGHMAYLTVLNEVLTACELDG